VHNEATLRHALPAARAEAEASFKDATVYLEKCIEHARHVEVQVMGDRAGNVLHFYERDCSMQRRHQKLIEESPPPGLPSRVAEAICKAALKYAEAVHYVNAGTVEFLLDRRGRFYFMEINARLQVEHPVTEMVTGVDLVDQQIRIASGEKLHLKQSHVEPKGVAIECRINAEDPDDGFKPSPGVLKFYNAPGGPGVRLDTHVYSGYTVSQYYDPLIGKLIVHGRDRAEAIAIMRRALDEFVIEGVKTTIPLYRTIFANTQFVQGGVDPGFIDLLFAAGGAA
jgi:acetyl-CoA carboxylase biotin carboxylase subunit